MLEKLKGALDKSVAAVSVKSESIVESSRVRSAISNTQKQLDGALSALGAKTYNAWAAGNLDPAVLEEDCTAIRDLNAELTKLKASLEQIKAEESQILGTQKKAAAPAGGFVFCTKCGKKLDAAVSFCDECGTPVQKA